MPLPIERSENLEGEVVPVSRMAAVWSGVNALGRPGNRPSSAARRTPAAMRRLIESNSACAAQAITRRMISPIICSTSVGLGAEGLKPGLGGSQGADAHPAPVQRLHDGHQFNPVAADPVQGGDGEGIPPEQPCVKAGPSRAFASRDGAGDSHGGTGKSCNRPGIHCWGMAPMRNFLAPQTTQVAWAAARPFFMVTAFRSADSGFCLALDAVDRVGVAGSGHGAFLLRASIRGHCNPRPIPAAAAAMAPGRQIPDSASLNAPAVTAATFAPGRVKSHQLQSSPCGAQRCFGDMVHGYTGNVVQQEGRAHAGGRGGSVPGLQRGHASSGSCASLLSIR